MSSWVAYQIQQKALHFPPTFSKVFLSDGISGVLNLLLTALQGKALLYTPTGTSVQLISRLTGEIGAEKSRHHLTLFGGGEHCVSAQSCTKGVNITSSARTV
jgi:hypothetical protein